MAVAKEFSMNDVTVAVSSEPGSVTERRGKKATLKTLN